VTLENLPSGSSFSGLPTRTLTGRIKVHPAGYGFVVPDDKSEDVHVSARNRGVAMDADIVQIEAWPGVRGVEGRVLRVIARGRAKITGQLARMGREHVLQPDDPRITGPVGLRGPIPHAADGVAVVAEITRYPDVPDGPIEAQVLKVLGDPDDPRTEVEKVLACADVDEAFPDQVARIADGLPQEVRDADRVDRADPARAARSLRATHDRDWAFFSGGDKMNYAGHPTQGLALPGKVLAKIFRENALRWIPGFSV